MKISEIVKVNTSYTRSINLERDLGSQTTSQFYVPTSRALQTLERISETLHGKTAPRAWALVGPYGSGKSAFGLFLSNILGSSFWEPSNQARALLETHSPKVAQSISNAIGESTGYLSIAITGSPEPLSIRLATAIFEASEAFRGAQRGSTPKFIKDVRAAVESTDEISISNLLDWICELQTYVHKHGGRGVLLVVDELGKFLEYEARHRQSTDMYLLQALAEHACAESDSHLLVVVLMHQAFEQYFSGLGEQLRNEWKKVHGRFESIPFLETSEQVLRIVKAALDQSPNPELKKSVTKAISKVTKQLEKSKALPTGLSSETAAEIFEGSYPLHPSSLLILPTLCQKVAQNERTLFSYLGSHEPHGFQDTLERLEVNYSNPQWVFPHEIYEYFILNQPGLVSDQLTHRRWAEVITAVERLGDASPATEHLLKTIGLLNIVGSQGGFKASEELLRQSFEGSPEEFDSSLKDLLDRSIITYRKFNSEYRVWQGSDFDLLAAVAEQREQFGRIDLAQSLNSEQYIPPIVARRHTIETGNLRYFELVFVDTPRSLNEFLPTNPTIFVCLSEGLEAFQQFQYSLKNTLLHNPHLIGCILRDAAPLREAFTEVLAYQRVQRAYPQASNDPVSSRELKDRLRAAQNQQNTLLSQLLEEPQQHAWIWDGREITVAAKRSLQSIMSDALERTFLKAPRINNELINRDKPSPSANAGRRKLFAAMLSNPHAEDLGFEKDPAEKSIYRSLFKSTGAHREVDGVWKFSKPNSKSSRLDLAWDAIDELLSNQSESIKISAILDHLHKPPYGLKAGASNLIVFAYWLSKEDELALFEEGHFCPFVTQEILDKLIKTPPSFSLQNFGFDETQKAIYEIYYEVSTLDVLKGKANLISAAKPFARFMLNLPDYSKSTRTVSQGAQQIREKFFTAKSPVQLMFYQIPEALGLKPLIGKSIDENTLNEFSKALASAMNELRTAYHKLLAKFTQQLRSAFRIGANEPLDRIREILAGRFSGLQDYTIDIQGTKAFIGRLTDPYGDDGPWQLSLASFLARKPPEKWTDDDALAVGYRLSELAEKVRELDTLRVHSERHDDTQKQYEVVLIRTLSQKEGQTERVVALTEDRRKYLQKIVSEIREKLDTLDDEELKTGAIALLLHNNNNGQGDKFINLDDSTRENTSE